jgi:hypothetical protein
MKKVVMGGLMGGFVLIVWLIVVDGLMGFKRNIEMNQIPDERTVYEFLKKHVTEPGRFIFNPEVTPDQRFPGDDPIFAVHYTGLGHDDAGLEMMLGLAVMLLAPIIGAWLLWNASSRVLSRYQSRVLFFASIGIVMALFTFLARFGLASYSLRDSVALTAHDLTAWVLAGLVVAWKVSPYQRRKAQATE